MRDVLRGLILRPFQIVWPPTMFAVEKHGYARLFYSRMLIYVSFVGMAVGLAMGLFAPEIVNIFAIPEYERAAPVVFVLVTASLVFVLQNVFNVGILLKRRTELFSLIFVAQTFACVLVWVFAVPYLGLIGAALGPLVGYSVGAILSQRISSRFLQVDYEWRRLALLAVLYVCLYAVSMCLQVSSLMLGVAVKLVLLMLYMLVPWIFGFWHEDEKDAFLECSLSQGIV